MEVGAVQILASFESILGECLHGFLGRSPEDMAGARLPIHGSRSLLKDGGVESMQEDDHWRGGDMAVFPKCVDSF